jgi:hypothetical protein
MRLSQGSDLAIIRKGPMRPNHNKTLIMVAGKLIAVIAIPAAKMPVKITSPRSPPRSKFGRCNALNMEVLRKGSLI